MEQSSILKLKEQSEQLLLLAKSGNISKAEAEYLVIQLKNAIKAQPLAGKELGQLVASINHILKLQPISILNWVQVSNGMLAIGHKPGGKISFEGLKQTGTTTVVTLLHEDEGAPDIGRQLQKVNINWMWFPFSASHPFYGDEIVKVFQLYKQLDELLNAGGKIYIHCSAGIHRTGMIAYGLLRYLGKEKSEALQLLHNLREVTAMQAGDEKLSWGDQFYKNPV